MKRSKVSPGFVAIIILLMSSFIYVQLEVFNFFEFGNPAQNQKDLSMQSLPSDQKSEQFIKFGLDTIDKFTLEKVVDGNESIKSKYDGRRAYPGAPPTVPHDVKSTADGGLASCLQCHQNGGFVKKMGKYAPVTPHPEYVNCSQCHVPKKTEGLFRETNWQKVHKLYEGKKWLRSSPPTIPHAIQLHENCMSCHVGNGGLKDIRVTHPDRVNCRQCHVPVNTNKIFERSKQ